VPPAATAAGAHRLTLRGGTTHDGTWDITVSQAHKSTRLAVPAIR
jgi:hypothetical protein